MAEIGREGDRQHQEGAGKQRVGDARDHHVNDSAEIAGDHAERHTDRDGNGDGNDAHQERGLRFVDDARENVAAKIVGAEPVGERRPLADRHPVGRIRLIARDQRRHDGDQNE